MATFVSMATCHTCNKTARRSGPSREFLASQAKNPNTPRSGGQRKTPQSSATKGFTSTPTSTPSQRTPFSTPKGPVFSESTSSGGKSSSSGVKKSAFSRLKKLLLLEDSPKAKKGGLKDFLSTL